MAFGFARFDLSQITRRIELPEVSVDPAKPIVLLVRYLGSGNRAWENWMFAKPKDDAPPAVDPDAPPPPPVDPLAKRDQNRADCRDMLLAAGISGWEDVTDDGRPVAFSVEAAERLVGELHDHVPDVLLRVVSYAMVRENFRGSIVDPVDLGKELPLG